MNYHSCTCAVLAAGCSQCHFFAPFEKVVGYDGVMHLLFHRQVKTVQADKLLRLRTHDHGLFCQAGLTKLHL